MYGFSADHTSFYINQTWCNIYFEFSHVFNAIQCNAMNAKSKGDDNLLPNVFKEQMLDETLY